MTIGNKDEMVTRNISDVDQNDNLIISELDYI